MAATPTTCRCFSWKPTSLLVSRESDVLEARHFLPTLSFPFTERLQMLSWDEATCWLKLEELCEEGKDKRYANEVGLGYAKLIVEVLARYGGDCEAKIRERLAVQVDDYSHHPMKWLEPLLVRLAGQAHLESMVPLIVAKLHDDADLLTEECAEALTRIGTPGVLQAVAEAYPMAERHFRLYSTIPMEHIHSDLAVETCLKLLPLENDELIQVILSRPAIAVRPGGHRSRPTTAWGLKLDFDDKGLDQLLLETCDIIGERFPEYEEWLVVEAAEQQEHRRRVKELEGDPLGLIKFAFEKLAGEKVADQPKAKPSPPILRTASPLAI